MDTQSIVPSENTYKKQNRHYWPSEASPLSENILQEFVNTIITSAKFCKIPLFLMVAKKFCMCFVNFSCFCQTMCSRGTSYQKYNEFYIVSDSSRLTGQQCRKKVVGNYSDRLLWVLRASMYIWQKDWAPQKIKLTNKSSGD